MLLMNMTKKAITFEQLIYGAILSITGLRLLAIFFTPLGLDVEEAQYWQWSTTPDLGYFTKPPMIAWVIGTGTSVFGENSFGVRAMAPIIHAVMTILVMQITKSVYSSRAGYIAAIIWMFLPISALGSVIMSTDTPMLLFLLAATLMLAPLAAKENVSFRQAGLAGIFTGLAMLSKYAAIYLPAGLLLWWIWTGRQSKVVNLKHSAAYVIGVSISLAPNLVWNIKNGFVTARHLSHNANLDEPQYSILGSVEFLLSQMGVVGPVIFILALMAMIIDRNDDRSKFWISLFAPAILVITVQAYFSDANANWAVASWPAAIILLAGYCDRYWQNLKRPYWIGLGLNISISFIFLVAIFAGSFGILTPASDPLRRLKAWDLHAEDIVEFAQENNVEKIVVMRRGHASKLIWELRDTNLEVNIVDSNGVAENHFEQKFPWIPKRGEVSIFINGEATPPKLNRENTAPSVLWQNVSRFSQYQISEKRERTLVMHLGLEQK